MTKTKKTYIITVSRNFMKDHPRSGDDTGFVEKLLNSVMLNMLTLDKLKDFLRDYDATDVPIKIHTMRENYAYWKKICDEVNSGIAVLSVRYWNGIPYKSKQTEFLSFEKIGYQSIHINHLGGVFIDGEQYFGPLTPIANNDGLDLVDFCDWFKYPKEFKGIIIHFTHFKY